MKAHIMTGTGTINAGPFTGVPGDSGTGGALGDPTMMETRWPDTDIPLSQPLPAGATVETTLVKTDRWNPDKFQTYLKVANQVVNVLERTGAMKGIPSGLDIGEALSYIATGAGIGATFGGIGAVVGAAVGLVLYAVNYIIRSGSGPVGPYANQQVAWWAGQFAEQAFVDWAVQNEVNTWGSTQDICRAQMVWWVETFGVAITAGTGGKFYSQKPDDIYIGYCGGEDAAAELYKQLGIDYYATKAARKANPETNQYDIHMQFGATTKMAGAGAGNLMPLLIGGAAVLYLSNKR
jgi:hypothetical protein